MRCVAINGALNDRCYNKFEDCYVGLGSFVFQVWLISCQVAYLIVSPSSHDFDLNFFDIKASLRVTFECKTKFLAFFSPIMSKIVRLSVGDYLRTVCLIVALELRQRTVVGYSGSDALIRLNRSQARVGPIHRRIATVTLIL